jgi:hypothetical protein
MAMDVCQRFLQNSKQHQLHSIPQGAEISRHVYFYPNSAAACEAIDVGANR